MNCIPALCKWKYLNILLSFSISYWRFTASLWRHTPNMIFLRSVPHVFIFKWKCTSGTIFKIYEIVKMLKYCIFTTGKKQFGGNIVTLIICIIIDFFGFRLKKLIIFIPIFLVSRCFFCSFVSKMQELDAFSFGLSRVDEYKLHLCLNHVYEALMNKTNG